MHERGIQLTWKETRTDSWQEQTLLQKGKTGGALNIGLSGLLESPTTIVSDLLRKVKTTCQFICKTTVLPDGEKCWKTLTGSTRINWCFNLPRRTKKMTGLKQKQKKKPSETTPCIFHRRYRAEILHRKSILNKDEVPMKISHSITVRDIFHEIIPLLSEIIWWRQIGPKVTTFSLKSLHASWLTLPISQSSWREHSACQMPSEPL